MKHSVEPLNWTVFSSPIHSTPPILKCIIKCTLNIKSKHTSLEFPFVCCIAQVLVWLNWLSLNCVLWNTIPNHQFHFIAKKALRSLEILFAKNREWVEEWTSFLYAGCQFHQHFMCDFCEYKSFARSFFVLKF